MILQGTLKQLWNRAARCLIPILLLVPCASEAAFLLPTSCSQLVQILEIPILDLDSPLESMMGYFRQKKALRALNQFDFDAYREAKLFHRSHLERETTPPPGTFEGNIAWFEAYLEGKAGRIFDFEESLVELPARRRDQLVLFFKRNRLTQPMTSMQLRERVAEFYEIVDHQPILASEADGSNPDHPANQHLRAKAWAIQLTINGLDTYFHNLGYLKPKNFRERLNSFLDHPAVVSAKLALFNWSLLSGVPSLYLPAVADHQPLSSEEIDQLLLSGDVESAYRDHIEPQLIRAKLSKLDQKIIRRMVYRNLRKRIVEVSAVVTLAYTPLCIADQVAHRTLPPAQTTQQAAAAQQMMSLLESEDHELDELIDRYEVDTDSVL